METPIRRTPRRDRVHLHPRHRPRLDRHAAAEAVLLPGREGSHIRLPSRGERETGDVHAGAGGGGTAPLRHPRAGIASRPRPHDALRHPGIPAQDGERRAATCRGCAVPLPPRRGLRQPREGRHRRAHGGGALGRRQGRDEPLRAEGLDVGPSAHRGEGIGRPRGMGNGERETWNGKDPDGTATS